MQWCAHVATVNGLSAALDAGLCEVLVDVAEISRMGEVPLAAFAAVAPASTRARLVLNWDLVLTDAALTEGLDHIARAGFQNFAAVRAREAGALVALSALGFQGRLQLDLEVGHKNMASVAHWVQVLGDRLERVAISPEVPLEQVARWQQDLRVPLELTLVGPVILLETPRPLLSAATGQDGQSIEAALQSEEAGARPFPTVQNHHGVFMFHHKWLCLLLWRQALEQAQIPWGRVDLRFAHGARSLQIWQQVWEHPEHGEPALRELMGEWSVGFIKANHTEKQTESRLLAPADQVVGTVVDTRREIYAAVKLDQSISLGVELQLLNPQGHQNRVTVDRLWNARGEAVMTMDAGNLCLIPWCRYAAPGAVVRRVAAAPDR